MKTKKNVIWLMAAIMMMANHTKAQISNEDYEQTVTPDKAVDFI